MAIEQYNIDPYHSSFTFWVSHLGLAKTCFTFLEWTGQIAYDESDLTKSAVTVNIKAESIESHNVPRDGHIRGEAWLDVAKYPEIAYRSTGIRKTGDKLEMVGDLTVKGITKPVTLDVIPNGKAKDMFNFDRIGFTAQGKFSRKEFGVVSGLSEGGSIMAGEFVELIFELEAVKGQ